MKTKMQNNIRYCTQLGVLFLLLLFLLGSCKSKKEGLSTPGIQTANALDAIASNMVQYNTLSANLKTQISIGKNKKKIAANATLRMIKNDKLQLSFQVPILGFEAFRLIISSDSILVIDRLNKSYMVESLSDIKKRTGFNYELANLQALLTCQLFLPGSVELTSNDWNKFRVEEAGNHAFVQTTDAQGINYSFTAMHNKIRSIEMADSNKNTVLLCTYGRLSKTSDNQLFPMEMNFSLKSKEDSAVCDFSFSTVDIDKKVAIEFDIPSKYQRVPLAQFIHLIQALS